MQFMLQRHLKSQEMAEIQNCKFIGRILVSGSSCKELGSCHSVTNNSSWIHKRGKRTRQTTAPETGEIGEHRSAGLPEQMLTSDTSVGSRGRAG